jgi:carboxyl-terminal processing protease
LSAAIAVVGFASMQVVIAAPSSNHVVLKPSMEQRYATNLVTRFLTNWHYKDTALDDELSEKIFDKYIELLDPNRAYFTDSDIYFLKRHKKHLDDALTHYETGPAFEIFNVYVERVAERMNYANELLAGEFDFTIEEEYSFDRSEADWLKSKADWQNLWRQRIKNDYLRLKLTGKEPEAIVTTLTDRYKNMERRIMELNEEDVFQFFMNSVTQSIEPHTSYLSPRTSANFEISMKLSLEGIGALLERQTEYTGIARVVTGGPADLDQCALHGLDISLIDGVGGDQLPGGFVFLVMLNKRLWENN